MEEISVWQVLDMDVNQILELARKNRIEFLEPYRKRVEDLQSLLSDPDKKVVRNAEREISNIVVDLLKIEPSHLDEVWISKIIQLWMSDYEKTEHLSEAFISQTGRDYRQTPQQWITEIKWLDFRFKVKKYVFEGCSVTEAIEKCSKETSHDFQYLWKKFYEKEDDPVLPFPYYGREIFQESDGKISGVIMKYLTK